MGAARFGGPLDAVGLPRLGRAGRSVAFMRSCSSGHQGGQPLPDNLSVSGMVLRGIKRFVIGCR